MSKNKDASIRKIARIHDKATGTYLEVVEFWISKSETSRLMFPPSVVVNDPSEFENKLRDAGATLPKDKNVLKQVLKAAAESDAPEQLVYETRTGWTTDRKSFVLPDEAIGTSKTKIIGVNRLHDVGDRSGRLSKGGTWKSWRDSVGDQAYLSTTLMFSISVALAAPLLAVAKRQSFAINLFGRTRVGKSLATLVSGSVIGTARTADLITWNITDARLEQRLAEFNDAVFPIDDLTTIKGGFKEQYQRVRNLAYNIAQGWATGRHTSFTASHRGLHQDWRVIALTSHEKSIRELARAAKQERQHGEVLRLIDVPAVHDELDHIFDRAPADARGSQDWKRLQFKEIVDACERNHGKAFRKYIKTLIADSKLQTRVQEAVSVFLKKVSDASDTDVARDVADKFGLIYAGGMLGIRSGLLNWEKRTLLDAVRKCYVAAVALLPDDGALLSQGVAALSEHLRRLPSVSTPLTKNDTKLDFENLDGYKQSTSKADHYVVKTRTLQAAIQKHRTANFCDQMAG